MKIMKKNNSRPYINIGRVYCNPYAGSGKLGCDVEKEEREREQKEAAEKEKEESAEFWIQMNNLSNFSI